MQATELLDLSLEQVVDALGDPAQALFSRMYERYPELEHFRDDKKNWEAYMAEEIFTNLMAFAEDPDTAELTIRDMVAHHQLIGLPVNVFAGLYGLLFETILPVLHGPHSEEMRGWWQGVQGRIEKSIARADFLGG